MHIVGGIEGGGTKIVCGVGNDNGEILDRLEFLTSEPDETINKIVTYFNETRKRYAFERVGLASFGPVDLDQSSKTYGYITNTPKAGWQNIDIKGGIERGIGLPVSFDNDVNGAALGEGQWGAAKDFRDFIYITIGTGIGGGIVVNKKLIHGLVHPEIGHVRLRCDHISGDFEGICPFHKYCFEGLASGPALEARWGEKAQSLPEDHPGWIDEAMYIAEGLMSIVLTISPELIILGGGVMKQEQLFPMIRNNLKMLLNNYVAKLKLTDCLDNYIVPPALGSNAGLMGAFALALNDVNT